MSDEQERWLPVPGFEGRYEVSDLGRIRSLRFTNGKTDQLRNEPLILKYRDRSISLCRDGKVYTKQVAPLVLLAFVGPRPPGYDCAHWDGNETNNRLSNLRWATHAEKEADKLRHGRDNGGERSHLAKLSNADALEIRQRLWAGERLRGIAIEYGVHWQTIRDLATHKTFRDLAGSPPPLRVRRWGGEPVEAAVHHRAANGGATPNAGAGIPVSTKLSDAAVREMRVARRSGQTLKQIAERHGVSIAHTHNIVTGRARCGVA